MIELSDLLARTDPGSPEALFWRRVSVTEHGCWEWQGYVNHRGYGVVHYDRKRRAAHRTGYLLAVGPIPDGLVIDHLCRNTRCVNPNHLEPVTNVENVMRGMSPAAQAARATVCKNGHPFDDKNTHIAPGSGKRRCRECHRARWRAAYYARKGATA